MPFDAHGQGTYRFASGFVHRCKKSKITSICLRHYELCGSVHMCTALIVIPLTGTGYQIPRPRIRNTVVHLFRLYTLHAVRCQSHDYESLSSLHTIVSCIQYTCSVGVSRREDEDAGFLGSRLQHAGSRGSSFEHFPHDFPFIYRLTLSRSYSPTGE